MIKLELYRSSTLAVLLLNYITLWLGKGRDHWLRGYVTGCVIVQPVPVIHKITHTLVGSWFLAQLKVRKPAVYFLDNATCQVILL